MFFVGRKLFSLLFFSPQTNFPKQMKYPVLTLLITILHNSSQDETIPGWAGTVVTRRRRSTPSTAAMGGGIAGGTTTTTTPALASGLSLALAPTAVATMAIARRSFNQEVEDHGAKLCVTTTTGGGIADRTTLMTTTGPASALALTSVPTAVATMAIAGRPFAQEMEDCGSKPRVTTTSRVLRDNCK